MRYKAVISIIVVAMMVASITPTAGIYAGNVTWDYYNDVLISNANEDRQQAESHIMVSASNNNNLVAALMDDTLTSLYRCRAYNSTNGGDTWTDRGFLSLPTGTVMSNDPVVASTSIGEFFIACFAGTSTRGTHIVYWISTDNGTTWSSPNIIRNVSSDSTLEVDKPWIAADVNDTTSRYRNNVYACWTEIKYPNTVAEEYSIKFRKIWPSTSTIKTVASPTNPSWVQWCNIAVGKSGIIYVTWMRALYNSTTGTYTYNVMMKRSFDGGATWSTARSIATFNPISTIYSYGVGFDVSNSPHIAVDNNGDLHLVYVTKTSAGDTEIMYRKITNCTSSTQSCNLQPLVNLSNNSKDQWEPAIVVSRSNIVHVTALDKRDAVDNNSWWRLYHYHCHLSTSTCTSSSDWYRVRVTNEGTYVYNMFANKVGHYHGIASSIASTNAREAYTTWTDSRLYNNNQDYNIFYDRLSSSN